MAMHLREYQCFYFIVFLLDVPFSDDRRRALRLATSSERKVEPVYKRSQEGDYEIFRTPDDLVSYNRIQAPIYLVAYAQCPSNGVASAL